ncbi:MAG TPA: hypothetical protein VH231_00060 [Solirubrobacteraceae bacterium]|jgi:peptidoglycan/LPS O-acetylase OafA/YrhL|nr:hypothetical protein [Solirubrobacteraceae bacterium]
MQGGRFGAGDGLRALAALAVVGFHAAVIASAAAPGHASGPVWAVASHLDLGLYVFFALSGYLIARPFARSLVPERRGRDCAATRPTACAASCPRSGPRC